MTSSVTALEAAIWAK